MVKVKAKVCCCNGGQICLSTILYVIGLYFLVWGFVVQIAEEISWSAWNWSALLYYLIGLAAIALGKWAKYNGCKMCEVRSR